MPNSSLSAAEAERRPSSQVGRLFFFYSTFLLGLAVFLGGGTRAGLASDLLLQIASLPLLVMAVPRLFDTHWPSKLTVPMILLGGLLLWPLLQLIPLPPVIWSSLSSRSFVLATYDSLNLPPPWLPLSLSSSGTRYALFSLFPAVAIFLTTLELGTPERFLLLVAPMGLAALSVFFGLAQRFGPNPAAVSLYDAANIGDAIGFFANRNHFAALLYSMLPLSVGWLIGQLNLERNRQPRWILFGSCVTFVLVAGLSVAFSRAGVTLGVVAAFGAVLLAAMSLRRLPVGRRPIMIVGALLLLFAIALQFGLIDLIEQRTAVDSYRETMARVTKDAIGSFYGIGSGFGTFVPIYQIFEKVGDVQSVYANHAHNDWLELTLEGGVIAVLLLAGFVCWFAFTSFRVWRGSSAEWASRDLILARAASLSIGLLLVHSTVDYPLRTTALNCVFAFCCALMCPKVGVEAPRRKRRMSSATVHSTDDYASA